MQTQFLYPSGDSSIDVLSAEASWTQSTSSSSGNYSYVDEGIATYNDSDYLYTSGLASHVNSVNILARRWTAFDLPDLQVVPSSIYLQLRTKYEPGIYSGDLTILSYLLTSGTFYKTKTINFDSYWNGLNYNSIVASSIMTLPSGSAFTTNGVNMQINAAGKNSFDMYDQGCVLVCGHLLTSDSGVVATNGGAGTYSLSAAQVIVSGELYKNAYLPLQICGGTYEVQSERLRIYHDFGSYGYIEPDDEYNITYALHTVENTLACPQMCLNSGTLNKSDIFRDCFFEFNQRPGVKNDFDFTSSVSSHKFNLHSSLSPGASGNLYVGHSYRVPQNTNLDYKGVYEDSYIYFEPYLTGIASGVFPSGDFGMWIGAGQLPLYPGVDCWFVRDLDDDIRVGISSTNRITASLKKNDGSRATVNGAVYDTREYGILVTYGSGGLGLYRMANDGSLDHIGQSSPFTRYTKTQPSGDLKFSLPNSFANKSLMELDLYEFGVVNSGLSDYDINRLDRYKPFEQIHSNIYVQPIVSGDNHITYESLEYRNNVIYSGSNYPITSYAVGPGLFGAYVSNMNIWDTRFETFLPNVYRDKNTQAVIPYTDISTNCHLSGNHTNYFQDGSVFFSGWIDASTTNPSGFLSNDLFIRIIKDDSSSYDLPDDYNIGGGGSTYSDTLLPIADNYQTDRSTGLWTNSSSLPSGYYTHVSGGPLNSSTTEWVRYTDGDLTLEHSGYISFLMTSINTPFTTVDNANIDVSFRTNFTSGSGVSIAGIYLTQTSGIVGPSEPDNVIASSLARTYLDGDVNVTHTVPLSVDTTYTDYSTLYLHLFVNGSGFNASATFDFYDIWIDTNISYDGTDVVVSGNYTDVLQARGKCAHATTTLSSGLNEYIVPLDKYMYYYDLYINSSGAIPTTAICYDTSKVAHPDWNGSDISLYYIGNNDSGNAGYKDTVKIYSAAIISDNWSVPPTGISDSLDLYMSGIGYSYSGIDLYLHANYSDSGIDLFLQSDTYNPYSGATPVNLICWSNSGEYNNSVDLNLLGNSGDSLIADGFDLFTFAEPTPTQSGTTNLFINSSTNTSIIDYMNLALYNNGITDNIPLFLKVNDGENTDMIPLFLMNNTTALNYVDLIVGQYASSVFDSQKLFIRGNGLYDGSHVGQSGCTLVIGDGPDPYSAFVRLTLAGPSGINGDTSMYINGGTYVASGVDLVMASSVGVYYNNMYCFTHGF